MDGMGEINETGGTGGQPQPDRGGAACGQLRPGGAPDSRQTLKAARRHFSMLGGMFLLGTVVTFLAQMAVMVILELAKRLKPEWSELLGNGDITVLASVLPMYLIGIPALVLLVHFLIPADKPERRRMKPGAFVAAAIMCYALVYICNILGNIVTFLIGALKGAAVSNELYDLTGSVSLWTILVWMVLIAPVIEEFVFRKLIVDRTVRYGEGVAVLVSGLMFGLFHGNLNQFAYAFSLGAFLAFLYVKTGNLKITIALHMLINFMGGLVSTWLMRQVDLEKYMEAASDQDTAAIMKYMAANPGPWVALGLFFCFVFAMMVIGGILFIICLVRKKFVFRPGAVVIPRGERFRTVVLNVGMMLYAAFWAVLIVLQLLK